MDEAALFRVAFIALFSLLTAVRFVFKLRAGAFRNFLFSLQEGTAVVAAKLALGAVLVGSTAGYILKSEAMPWAFVDLPPVVRGAGTALGFFSLGFLVAVHLALGRNFTTSVRLKKDHRLVTWGPYQRIRHPMYSSYVGLFAGAFLISENILIGVSGLGIIAVLMTLRLEREEENLIDRFGDRYRGYMASTGKFLPRSNGRGS